MRTFQVLFAAIGAISVAHSEELIASRSYGSSGDLSLGGITTIGGGISKSISIPAVSQISSIGAGQGISYSASPVVSRISTISAAPAIQTISAAPAIQTISAAPAISSYSSAPVVSRIVSAPAISTISAAPVYSTLSAGPAISSYAAPSISVAAAPAVSARIASISAAPAVSSGGAAVVGQAINLGVIGSAGTPTVRSHEIHTGSGSQAIRIEDFQSGDQVIRVHEGAQAAPEVAQIAVPGDQHHVRIVEHGAGPAHVERVVSRGPTQVIDVEKPGRPSARIIQVVKGQSPPPSIEFVQDGGSSHQVYYSDDIASSGGSIGGGSVGVIGGGGLIGGGLVSGGSLGGGIISGGSLGGGIISGGSLGGRIISGGSLGGGIIGGGLSQGIVSPATTVVTRSVPATTVLAAPAVSYGNSVGYGLSSGVQGITYGSGIGHYGVGYGSNGVYSDYIKKASAAKKKSA